MHAKINGKEILLPKDRLSKFNRACLNKEVVLGVRPKSIKVGGDLGYEEQGFRGGINLFEQLVEDTLVYSSFPGLEGDLVISTSGLGRFHKGEEISICFDLSSVCLFDEESGESLL